MENISKILMRRNKLSWRLVVMFAFVLAVAVTGCQKCFNKKHQRVKSKEDAIVHYNKHGGQMHQLSQFLSIIIPDSTRIRIVHSEHRNHYEVKIFDDLIRNTIFLDSTIHKSLTPECIERISEILHCEPTEVSMLFSLYEQTDCIGLLYPSNILRNNGMYLKYRFYSHFYNYKCGFYIFNTSLSIDLKDAVNGSLDGPYRHMQIISDSALLWF